MNGAFGRVSVFRAVNAKLISGCCSLFFFLLFPRYDRIRAPRPARKHLQQLAVDRNVSLHTIFFGDEPCVVVESFSNKFSEKKKRTHASSEFIWTYKFQLSITHHMDDGKIWKWNKREMIKCWLARPAKHKIEFFLFIFSSHDISLRFTLCLLRAVCTWVHGAEVTT